MTKNSKTRSHQEQLGVKQSQQDTVKTEIVSVTSNNQSGGITANQVNIGVVSRKLDFNLQNQILLYMKDKSEQIKITSVYSDSESFQFANQINDFLKSQGFIKVEGVIQNAFTKPVIGQYLYRDSSGVKILIGSKPN